MAKNTDYFKGKRVTVMRIGLIGRGIGDTKYLAEAGAKITVVDDAPQAVMQPAVDALAGYPDIIWKFGPYDFADFENADLVLVGAGAPLFESVLLACREAGVRLTQSAALFAKLSGVPIIGVTGTRGKSTVTQMIYHTLSVVTGEKILLGGNVRGVSNLQLLKEVEENSLCVMELDSWQLQGFGWEEISPQIAVFTNFMEDHLNYYERGGKSHDEAMALYLKDKAQIFWHQEASDVLVATPEVFAKLKTLPEAKLEQEVILVDASVLPEDMLLAMPGQHNRLNAALAYEALKALSLTDEEIFDGLASFAGVEGRLQFLGTVKGAKVFNDNNATTPQATTVALEALGSTDKNIILIAGGNDKGIALDNLLEAVETFVKKVFLIPGTGTDNLLSLLKTKAVPVEKVADLKTAWQKVLSEVKEGEIILFSPAFSSFAQYKNEYERNDEFVGLVEKAKEVENKMTASDDFLVE